MTHYVHFHTNCGEVIGFAMSEEKWPENRGYARGMVDSCPNCDHNCPMYHIAHMASFQEFAEAVNSQTLKIAVPESA